MTLALAGKPFWQFVADCGDIAVILPAYLAVAAVLALLKRQREAILWGLGLIACAAIAGLLKVEIGAFQLTLLGHTFHAASFPSGHSSLSLAFYGGLAVLVGYRAPSPLGRVAAALLLVFVALIAVAVWMLWWHPSMDIVCGLALGALCLAPLMLDARPRRRSSRELAAVLGAAVLLVAALHGTHFDDRALQGLSMRQVFLPRG